MRHGAAYDGGGGGGGVTQPLTPPQAGEQSCLEQLLCALCTPICKEVGIDLQQMQQQNQTGEQVHLTQPQPQHTGMKCVLGLWLGHGVRVTRIAMSRLFVRNSRPYRRSAPWLTFFHSIYFKITVAYKITRR